MGSCFFIDYAQILAILSHWCVIWFWCKWNFSITFPSHGGHGGRERASISAPRRNSTGRLLLDTANNFSVHIFKCIFKTVVYPSVNDGIVKTVRHCEPMAGDRNIFIRVFRIMSGNDVIDVVGEPSQRIPAHHS